MYTCGKCGREMDEVYYTIFSRVTGKLPLCDKCIELPVSHFIEWERKEAEDFNFEPLLEFSAGPDPDPVHTERIVNKLKGAI